jgi:hypothetical protein
MMAYEVLAKRYAAPLPPSAPTPLVGSGWTSIQRFFGHNTTWRTDIK